MSELVDIPSPGWPLEFGVPGRAGVVIVHDEYGRLPYLESYGTALAAQGFHVVVPDLFDGKAAVHEAGAAELVARVDEGFAQATLDDAIGFPRAAGATRVGVIGLGLGGRLALRAAQSGAADAVVTYYATLGDDEGGIIPCPVMLHRAAGDEFDAFVSRVKEHGTPVTQHSYAASSGFANATVAELVDPQAAALAFARSVYFMQAQLLD
ncbi:dienelactone hydrolase family protein [Herbiconiux sp. A18JL235]|uniref:Dienelactone hydrolase family protein n=1 Tax=Herbiconiux sp. A18JL235 TaxID=3152363 RepID=A0AB39BGC8_9MICO